MSASHASGQEISQILDTFSNFLQKTVETHPRKTQIISQMNSFISFLSNNREDLSKGYQYLKEMKSLNEEKRLEISFCSTKTTNSDYHGIKQIIDYENMQEMRILHYDSKNFSYDFLLLLISIKFWDLLLSFIDQCKLQLLQTIKEKVFHDTLSQAVQEKITAFFEKIEQIAKTEKIPYKKALEKMISNDKTSEFLITMVPVIKQIIIKFLINSEWNFVRERLQDKLNTNSLNQIFTLFKSQSNFPQKELEVQNMDENTQNFLQILALGLNININFVWCSSLQEKECLKKSFTCKNKEEAVGTANVFVIKKDNSWLYFNLFNNENVEMEASCNNLNKKSNELEKFDSNKHFQNFSKSTSIKISEEMFPLNITGNNNLQKQSQEEINNNDNIRKKNFANNVIKPTYLLEFLASFQETTDEIYEKIFNNTHNNNNNNNNKEVVDESKKLSFKRYLSSDLEPKVDLSDENHGFLSNNRKAEAISAGIKPQNNVKNGFIQKCSKCPKEYVEYEVKHDNSYLCYICR